MEFAKQGPKKRFSIRTTTKRPFKFKVANNLSLKKKSPTGSDAATKTVKALPKKRFSIRKTTERLFKFNISKSLSCRKPTKNEEQKSESFSKSMKSNVLVKSQELHDKEISNQLQNQSQKEVSNVSGNFKISPMKEVSNVSANFKISSMKEVSNVSANFEISPMKEVESISIGRNTLQNPKKINEMPYASQQLLTSNISNQEREPNNIISRKKEPRPSSKITHHRNDNFETTHVEQDFFNSGNNFKISPMKEAESVSLGHNTLQYSKKENGMPNSSNFSHPEQEFTPNILNREQEPNSIITREKEPRPSSKITNHRNDNFEITHVEKDFSDSGNNEETKLDDVDDEGNRNRNLKQDQSSNRSSTKQRKRKSLENRDPVKRLKSPKLGFSAKPVDKDSTADKNKQNLSHPKGTSDDSKVVSAEQNKESLKGNDPTSKRHRLAKKDPTSKDSRKNSTGITIFKLSPSSNLLRISLEQQPEAGSNRSNRNGGKTEEKLDIDNDQLDDEPVLKGPENVDELMTRANMKTTKQNKTKSKKNKTQTEGDIADQAKKDPSLVENHKKENSNKISLDKSNEDFEEEKAKEQNNKEFTHAGAQKKPISSNKNHNQIDTQTNVKETASKWQNVGQKIIEGVKKLKLVKKKSQHSRRTMILPEGNATNKPEVRIVSDKHEEQSRNASDRNKNPSEIDNSTRAVAKMQPALNGPNNHPNREHSNKNNQNEQEEVVEQTGKDHVTVNENETEVKANICTKTELHSQKSLIDKSQKVSSRKRKTISSIKITEGNENSTIPDRETNQKERSQDQKKIPYSAISKKMTEKDSSRIMDHIEIACPKLKVTSVERAHEITSQNPETPVQRKKKLRRKKEKINKNKVSDDHHRDRNEIKQDCENPPESKIKTQEMTEERNEEVSNKADGKMNTEEGSLKILKHLKMNSPNQKHTDKKTTRTVLPSNNTGEIKQRNKPGCKKSRINKNTERVGRHLNENENNMNLSKTQEYCDSLPANDVEITISKSPGKQTANESVNTAFLKKPYSNSAKFRGPNREASKDLSPTSRGINILRRNLWEQHKESIGLSSDSSINETIPNIQILGLKGNKPWTSTNKMEPKILTFKTESIPLNVIKKEWRACEPKDKKPRKPRKKRVKTEIQDPSLSF